MQTAQVISYDQLMVFISHVYNLGPVVVRESYSSFGCNLRKFDNETTLLNDIGYDPGLVKVLRQYTIHFLEANGHTYEKRIELDPKRCDGHRFRFNLMGWGLVHLNIEFVGNEKINCRISVNSVSRANTWTDTYGDLKSPDEWNWSIIKSKMRKLVTLLRKLGKQNAAQQSDASETMT